jgi:hypothetical protein
MDLRETGCGISWTDLALDRDRWRALVNAVIKFQIPQNDGNLSSGYTIGGLSSSGKFLTRCTTGDL